MDVKKFMYRRGTLDFYNIPEDPPIKDAIYLKCWGDVEWSVSTYICYYHCPRISEKLLTERQWAMQGYVVDRPTPMHVRGRYLWTNSYCVAKCLYYFESEVRKASADELRAFFAHKKVQ